METDALQTMTRDACQRMKGKLWPNQIGFDMRGGWMISYSERAGQWFAGRQMADGKRRRFAYGQTPEAALDEARKAPATED